MSKSCKNYIDKLIHQLRYFFYLTPYTIHLVFADDLSERKKNDDPDRTTVATIKIDDVYFEITVTLSKEQIGTYWKDKEYDRIAECLVHEFAHTITEPLYNVAINAITNKEQDWLNDLRERQTQLITNIAMEGIPDKWLNPNRI